jgi:hypothetical protein
MRDEDEISSHNAASATAKVREQLLRDGLEGCLPLAHFHSVVSHAAVLPSARRELLFRTVRSLIEDELMVVGRIGGDIVEQVDPWELSPDDAIARIHDEYVVHHDDRDWVFGIWFALTDSGEQAAQALEAKKPEG